MGNSFEVVDAEGINTKYGRQSLYIFGKMSMSVQV